MNKKLKYISIALMTTVCISSCNKALDINENPNAPTESTPELVLPQAMVATSQLVPQFNTYGGRLVGYYATSGGVSGWGDMITYDFNTGTFAGLWNGTYNVLTDLEYVINHTENTGLDAAFYYAAEVLKAYNYANLVDTYNDVPYSEALKGTAFLTPKYDEASTIYVDLAKKLDLATAFFKNATSLPSKFESADIIFKGNKTNWAKFSNTLKLRLVLRAGTKAPFENKSIDAVGVLDTDAIVQPGFAKISGKQNPMWNTWAYLASGNSVGTWGTQFIPTPYILSFYDGSKLLDEPRAAVVFANGIAVNKNQLGNTEKAPAGVAPSAWVLRPASGTISSTNYRGTGVMKGPTAGQPLMLAAEAQFLGAEAIVEGLLTGDAKLLFENGIKQSFNYLNKNESGAATKTAAELNTYFNDYKTNNTASFLANFDLATDKDKKIEAIVTQKYIALNFLFAHEAWNEWRRTNYPKISGNNSSSNAKNTFVSIVSQATSPDRLPTRILYPNTEFSYNADNIPAVDKYSSKIFWAK